MEDKLTAIKVTMVAVFAALGSFLGWKGVLAAVWAVMMLIDYISGTAAAFKEGTWCSKIAREGLFHKGGMILVVTVSLLADVALKLGTEYLALGFTWPGIVLPLVLCWYIITEIGSVLENAVKMGAPVPGWLVKLMKVGLKAVDKLAEPEDTEASSD